MLFGLANALSSFQNFINDILENNILALLITTHVNNIPVFSNSFHDYRQHVKTVLACFQATCLQLDINKCKFEVYEIKYLGLIIQSTFPDSHPACIKMCPVITSFIDSWESPQSVKNAQSFLGFVNFNQSFIKDFAKLVAFISAPTRKNKQFQQTSSEEEAFQVIKKVFTTASILQHFDPDKECNVKAHASDYVFTKVLSQPNHESILQPVVVMPTSSSKM